MVNIPILQIVGFQNSGKTTLMVNLVKKCVENNLRVGTIKHHGHGGKPFLHHSHKDSVKHRNAGAAISAVEGEGVIELTSQMKIDLEKLLLFYNGLQLDAILIEGYKDKSFPKIVLIKNHEDLLKLAKLTNIQAVITWIKLEDTFLNKRLIFSIHDEVLYMDWILTYLRDSRE